MGQVTVEFADVVVSGRVTGLGRSEKLPETWVRFKAADGELPVILPDSAGAVPPLVVGELVEMSCIPSMRTFGRNTKLELRAASVRRVASKKTEP